MRISRWIWGWMLAGVLASCGGSGGKEFALEAEESSTAPAGDLISGQSGAMVSSRYGMPAEGVDRAQMLRKLSVHFNGRFADQPEALMGARKADAGSVALQKTPKAGSGTPLAVHRFFNTLAGVHFYTMSESEKARLVQTLPHFNYEGRAFFALTGDDLPLSPVFRFYSIYTGTHFYTISSEERDFVLNNYSEYFILEGTAWYATLFSGPGWVPMHRFYNNATGTHFYTTSEQERQHLIASVPYLEYEGIGYYVRASGESMPASPISPSNSAPRLPCITGSSGTESVDCAGPDALPVSSHIEGRRGSSFMNGNEQCLFDEITGLYWENKHAGLPWSWDSFFTHLDRTDHFQVMTSFQESAAPFSVQTVPRQPTLAEIGATNNSVTYVNYVNSVRLCGFSDWRIPTASELANVMNFGYPALRVPNVDGGGTFISSDRASWEYDARDSGGLMVRRQVDGLVTVGYEEKWDFNRARPYVTVDYGVGGAVDWGSTTPRGLYRLLLVHGPSAPKQSRYQVVSIAYGRDASNNAVVDTWSHLQWRRCLEGQIWTGSTCSGTPLKVTVAQALAGAANKWGWRMPGIKELETLYVRNPDTAQLQMSEEVFPLVGVDRSNLGFWSMTLNQFMGWVAESPGSLVQTYVDDVTAFRANFEGTTLGKPTSTVREVPVNETSYVRLLRVHP